jgi:hypothetical protein
MTLSKHSKRTNLSILKAKLHDIVDDTTSRDNDADSKAKPKIALQVKKKNRLGRKKAATLIDGGMLLTC